MQSPFISMPSARSVFCSLGLAFSTLAVPMAIVAPLPGHAEIAIAPNTMPAGAEVAQIAELIRLMRVGEVIDVMRREGLDYGKTLEAEMFPGSGGMQWQKVLGLIYDGPNMQRRFEAALAKHMAVAGLASGPDLAEIEAFYGSDLGQKVVKLEIEARRALLEQGVEDAAQLAWADMAAEAGERVDLLQRFAVANDLIESNVGGAMNANLAFYRGMAEAGAFPGELSEEQMLSDIWGQEPDVRAETEGWLYPYLALSYQSLSDGELQAYIDYSDSPVGKKLNAAMFAAFDDLFTRISHDLGRAAAGQMLGEDI